jgi:pilus assembly protein CpaB
MKSKSIFLMAVSLGFGLVAAIGITQVMGRNKPQVAAEVPKHSVLVAVADLDINTELTPEMFTIEQWPDTMMPEGVATSLEDIEGKVITSRAGKRGPIYLSNLVNKTEMNQKKIPAGFKVIGIPLGNDDHMYGLLQPGDLVDLIAVFKQSNKSGPSSQTFLRRVRVFSVGASTSKDPENRNTAKGNTVVGLLVNEKQSEQVVLVKRIADLKLALRSNQEDDNESQTASRGTTWGDEDENGSTVGVLAQMLQNSFGKMSVQPAAADTTEKKQFTVTVYNSEGPVQYHFDETTGSTVPLRTEGFNPSATPKKPEGTPPVPDLGSDLEDTVENADPGVSEDDLDSEPGS